LRLGSYLRLVDYTARLFREGKAAISREVAEIFDRLGSSAETWQSGSIDCEPAACSAASSRPVVSA
jgi:hypothetical protein